MLPITAKSVRSRGGRPPAAPAVQAAATAGASKLKRPNTPKAKPSRLYNVPRTCRQASSVVKRDLDRVAVFAVPESEKRNISDGSPHTAHTPDAHGRRSALA